MTAGNGGRRRIVVIGAGVMGLSAAVEMASIPGTAVTILESGYPGGGSTGRSAGVYTRSYIDRTEVEIRAASIDRLYGLDQEQKLTLRRIGFMRIGRDAATDADLAASVDMQEEVGIGDPARMIDREEFERLVPDFDSSGVTSALYCPSEGYLDGAELCTVLAEQAVELGVKVAVRARLRNARTSSSGAVELETDAGAFTGDVVVNCAGAWAGEVGEILGAPIGIVNERHEAFILELPPDIGYEVPMVMDWVPGGSSASEGLYFRQEGDGQIVAGMHSSDIIGEGEVNPDDFFEGVTERGTENIVRALAEAFPDLELRLRGGWAGIYPHGAGGAPLLGPYPGKPSVLVGAGLGGVGLSLGPGMGKLLAEWFEFGEPRSVAAATELVPPSA